MKPAIRTEIAAHVLCYLEASDAPGVDGALDHVAYELRRKLTREEAAWVVQVFTEERAP